MSGEGTYAPKSPDLSSLFAGPAVSTNANNNNHNANSQVQQDYYSNQNQDYQFQGRSNQQGLHLQPPPNYYQQQPPHSPSAALGGGLPQQPQPHHHQPLINDPYSPRQVQQPPHQQYYPPTSPQQQAPHQLPSGFGLQQPQQYFQQPYGEQQGYPYSAPAQSYSQPPFYDPSAIQAPLQPPADLQPHQLDSSAMPPRRAAAQAAQTPVIEPSPVKTKFPTARIKRIMQADEEVGKVAQQTPIAVGKALEMFMIALVTKSADVAKEKNSKRVTAQMLKHVVESDDQWDFLREIVGRVENEDKAKSGGRTKAESESDEDAAEAKKKVKGGRKKKA